VLGRDGGLTLSGRGVRRYDAPVTSPRRIRSPGLPVLFVVAAIVVIGCGSATPATPVRTASVAPKPSLTPVPGRPGATPSPTAVPTSVAEGFGPIWDALPSSFPTLPGQSQSEVGSDASEGLVVRGQPVALARRLGDALRQQGWTVDVGSPLEDGTVVLEASGTPDGCKVEARFEPPSPGDDLGRLLIYYGASCPFS
jgi:hypothetical protein